MSDTTTDDAGSRASDLLRAAKLALAALTSDNVDEQDAINALENAIESQKENTMPTREDPELLRKILRNAPYDAEGAGAAAQSQADAAHDAAVEMKEQI